MEDRVETEVRETSVAHLLSQSVSQFLSELQLQSAISQQPNYTRFRRVPVPMGLGRMGLNGVSNTILNVTLSII